MRLVEELRMDYSCKTLCCSPLYCGAYDTRGALRKKSKYLFQGQHAKQKQHRGGGGAMVSWSSERRLP